MPKDDTPKIEHFDTSVKISDVWFLLSAQQSLNGDIIEALVNLKSGNTDEAAVSIEKAFAHLKFLNERMTNLIARGGALIDGE